MPGSAAAMGGSVDPCEGPSLPVANAPEVLAGAEVWVAMG